MLVHPFNYYTTYATRSPARPLLGIVPYYTTIVLYLGGQAGRQGYPLQLGISTTLHYDTVLQRVVFVV